MPADPRALMRAHTTAALGTAMDGAPYVSLVLVAFDADGAPLLLLSRLAQHTRNLLADPRVSLLFDGTEGFEEPLTGPRLTVLGSVAACPDPEALERYLARHLSAVSFAEFSDFDLYKVTITRGHLVAGFGKIRWVEATALTDGAPAAWIGGSRSAWRYFFAGLGVDGRAGRVRM